MLPPIFRLLAHAFTLPHRRFYTPATDYTSVPPEKGLYPIPSVIDLPSMMEMEMDAGASGHRFGVPGGIYGERSVKQRGAKARGRQIPDAYPAEKVGLGLGVDEYGAKEEVVKHYDADGECLLVSVRGACRSTSSCSLDKGLCLLRNWHARVRCHPHHVRGIGMGRAHSVNCL